jgi:hypothetical protein
MVLWARGSKVKGRGVEQGKQGAVKVSTRVAGAIGCHPYAIADDRPPRGDRGLTRSGAVRGVHGERAGRTWKRAGPALAVGREAGRRPVKPEIHFSFLFSNSRISKPFQIQTLKKKKAFLRLDPKIEVVQNLIRYNFALGHILKFQTNFELRVQSPFFIKFPIFVEYF